MENFVEIFCLIIGIMGIVFSLSLLAVYVIFTKFPRYTAKTGAFLYYAEQKNNVKVHSVKGKSVFVKNLTKGFYRYKVANKLYKVKKTDYFTTKKQTPKIISIIYLKFFPRIYYVNELDSFTEFNYLLYGLIGVVVSICIIALSVF